MNPVRPGVLLLGLGNDLLTDDSIGLRVVAAVRDQFAGTPDLAFGQTTEMGLALLDLIVGFEELVLVDAIQTGQAAPGSVHELEGADLVLLPGSPHFLGVGEVLALGRKLGLTVPSRVRLLGVEIEDGLTVGTGITPVMEAAFPRIVESVLDALAHAKQRV